MTAPPLQIFVYEHLTGGGLLSEADRLDETASLAVEGQGMLAALTADLAAVNGIEIAGLRDRRVGGRPRRAFRRVEVNTPAERDTAFDRFAAQADWTVVIAPEIGGALAERCQRVVEVGGRLLGGSLEMVRLAGDKHATARRLAIAGVPVPHGVPHSLGQPWPDDLRYPAIWKPLDGAGSAGLRLIEHGRVPVPPHDPRPGRLEELCPRISRRDDHHHHTASSGSAATRGQPGIAASVAFLCGPTGHVELPPCRQHLAEDFRYLGGSLPLEPHLAERAGRLARRAIETLPAPLGYVGVDLVLSRDGETGDVVIEMNPRLTTSYVGLRAVCRENLAAAMLAVATGQPTRPSFRDAAIEWVAGGHLIDVVAISD